MPRPVLVLDLDGTVCLGDDPVREYARLVEAGAPHAAGLVDALEEFLRDPDARPDLRVAQDGYQAVQLLGDGLDPGVLDEAYHRSRAGLHADLRGLHAPVGLGRLLDELDVHAVLVTNAPGDGLPAVLDHLGLGDRLDEVRTDAGKPSRMRRALADLLDGQGIGATPGHLMSVGDIWRNDLAPALELGCATAYVDTYGRRQGPAHVWARTLPELYPSLRAWAADPAEFGRSHPLPPAPMAVGATPERPGTVT